MSLQKDVSELVKANIITTETADKILAFYSAKNSSSNNRLFTAFAMLGAILVGLGIILIIAHNWDEFSRSSKTLFAFLPILIGQIFCSYTLLKNQNNTAWSESSCAFLFFAVGASISLVSQIYNIPGDVGSFMLTWMLLCLPLVYIFNSSITSLLYIIGITYYAVNLGYWSYKSAEPYLYWILLFGVLPHYYHIFKNKPESNFMVYHNWLLPVSIIISLGTVAEKTEEWMFVAYISLFGLFCLIGEVDFFSKQKLKNNAFSVLGSFGTISLLLALSFDWFWEELTRNYFSIDEFISEPEFYDALVISLIAGFLFYTQNKNKSLKDIKPSAIVFILFIILFILGHISSISLVLINLLVLGIGISTIKNGAKMNSLGILNYGLLIIAALVICRFFDSHLSFVIRGLMFVMVGAGFFATNYWMLKKRKTNE